MRISDITFIVYALSLLVAFVFQVIAIARIGSILRGKTDLKLKKTHMVLHAVFLIVNILTNMVLTIIYASSEVSTDLSLYISFFYFCFQPLSLLMMLTVIWHVSASDNPH